jgi:methyl-accepting chemotaxis protein
MSEEKGPEEIREEIEETREELGDTVAAVAEKTDVKKQAKAKVEDVKARTQQNPTPLAIGGAVVGLLVLWRLLRR